MLLKVPCTGGRTIADLTARYRGVDSRITDANFPCSRTGTEELEVLYPILPYEGVRPNLACSQILDALASAGHASLDAAALLTLGLKDKTPHVAFAQTYKDPTTDLEYVMWVSNGYASLTLATHKWGSITKVPAISL